MRAKFCRCVYAKPARWSQTLQQPMTVEDEVSLRPLALRPGGNVANPFSSFGKGLGFGIRGKKVRTFLRRLGDLFCVALAPNKRRRSVAYLYRLHHLRLMRSHRRKIASEFATLRSSCSSLWRCALSAPNGTSIFVFPS